MTLHINGEPRDFTDGLTLAGLIAQLGMKPDRIAVELNLEIVHREKWEATTLKEGDRLEIVHFVGGGSAGPETTSPFKESTYADWTCPACGAAAYDGFCSVCGEKKLSCKDLSIAHLISHAAGELLHYDSKMFRSFRLLLARPGFLTGEYLRGCRKPYLHPFQLFLIANLIYFFVQPWTGWSGLKAWFNVQTHAMFYSGLASRMAAHRMAARNLTEIQLNNAFDHAVNFQARSLVLLIVPLLAILIWALQWRKRRLFAEHLVFALHATAFALLVIYIGIFGGSTALVHLCRGFGIRVSISPEYILRPLAYLALAFYSFAGFRRVYGDSAFWAALKMVIFVAAFDYIVDIYHFFLFLTALYSS